MKRGRYLSFLVITAVLITSSACSPAARSRTANALGASLESVAPVPQSKLMVFGEAGHHTYLGCLSCSQYSMDSIFNEYGSYGSRYSMTSIWNHYADAGSRYSDYGACNPYANDPPVIVDSSGNYYGRMTLNVYHPQIGYGVRYLEWLKTTVCEE